MPKQHGTSDDDDRFLQRMTELSLINRVKVVTPMIAKLDSRYAGCRFQDLKEWGQFEAAAEMLANCIREIYSIEIRNSPDNAPSSEFGTPWNILYHQMLDIVSYSPFRSVADAFHAYDSSSDFVHDVAELLKERSWYRASSIP